MSDETGSPAGIEAVALPADAPETFTSTEAAADYFSALKSKPPKEQTAESADEPATAETELPDEGNADPETAHGEDGKEAEPEATPPIERPRSWSKDDDDEWNALPRARQEKIAANERARELDIRNKTNEIAEERKAAKAEREAAEKVRQQYEAQLPQLMQELQNAQQNTFSDIKTVDDVTKLANEDPFRYLQWQAHQTKLQAVNAENERARNDKQQATQAEWQSYCQKQNELAAEYIPELADKVKGPALMNRVGERMKELGFKQDELNGFVSGEKISPFDYRFQRLLANDLKLSDIQSAPKAVAEKPLPPVQRPGTSKPQGSGTSERIQALTRQLNETGDLSVAQELRNLQMRRA